MAYIEALVRLLLLLQPGDNENVLTRFFLPRVRRALWVSGKKHVAVAARDKGKKKKADFSRHVENSRKQEGDARCCERTRAKKGRCRAAAFEQLGER